MPLVQLSDVIVVMTDGAEGMEGVMAAKTLCPETDLIWLSDDEGFGPQSYRLGCTYFGTKPITKHLVSHAYRRCMRSRVEQ